MTFELPCAVGDEGQLRAGDVIAEVVSAPYVRRSSTRGMLFYALSSRHVLPGDPAHPHRLGISSPLKPRSMGDHLCSLCKDLEQLGSVQPCCGSCTPDREPLPQLFVGG